MHNSDDISKLEQPDSSLSDSSETENSKSEDMNCEETKGQVSLESIEESQKPIFFNKSDWATIILLLLLAPIFFLLGTADKGRIIKYEISSFGDKPEKITIIAPESGIYELDALAGKFVLEFSKDGKVKVKSSECPSKNCVRQGFAGAGESIICIPNMLMVEPIGEEKRPVSEVDAVTK